MDWMGLWVDGGRGVDGKRGGGVNEVDEMG